MLEVKNRILELLINSTLVKDKWIYIYRSQIDIFYFICIYIYI